MQIHLDRSLCRGHGRCYALCPEVFEEDDEGYSVIRVEELPPEFEAKARQAADNCPETAIRISPS